MASRSKGVLAERVLECYTLDMTKQVLEKIQELTPQKIGRMPVVVLPLEMWKQVEYRLEDLEIAESQMLAKKIAKARKEKKLYSASEIRRAVGIPG